MIFYAYECFIARVRKDADKSSGLFLKYEMHGSDIS